MALVDILMKMETIILDNLKITSHMDMALSIMLMGQFISRVIGSLIILSEKNHEFYFTYNSILLISKLFVK
jgi:hypothetical protein